MKVSNIQAYSYKPVNFKNKDADCLSKYLRIDKNGKLIAHKADFLELCDMNIKIENDKNLLNFIYTDRDKNGNTPMFYKVKNKDVKSCHEILRALKDYPVIIEGINKARNSSECKTNLHIANKEITQEIFNSMKDNPRALMEILEIPDKKGNLPIHTMSGAQMKIVHDRFSFAPYFIESLHTSANEAGELPIHIATSDGLKEIFKVFKDKPDVLAQILVTKNNNGVLPIKADKFLTNTSARKFLLLDKVEELQNDPRLSDNMRKMLKSYYPEYIF